MRMFVFGFLVAALSPSVLAEEPVRPLALQSPTDVVLDRSESGAIFALGNDWKMQFDATGATFLPCLGERAPRNLGVHFALGDGVVPVLAGRRVTIDRGAFHEVYDLSPQSVEQSFVFASRPADGDLTLRLPLETDLEYATSDASGLALIAEGIGGVRYGHVTVLDADQRRFAVESTYHAGALEIRVPDAFLDGARFPLVIDPVVSTIPVDGTNGVDSESDAVFSATTNSYLVAYERTVSALDHDILVRRFTANGSFIESYAIQIDSANTRRPALAERLGTAVVVYTRLLLGAGIKGRQIDIPNATLGAIYTVSQVGDVSPDVPDVGATLSSVTRPFLVVWRIEDPFGDTDIAACLMDAAGTNVSYFTQVCSNFKAHDEPCVAQRVPAGQNWVIAHSADTGTTQPQREIMTCVFTPTGTPVGSKNLSLDPTHQHSQPRVSVGTKGMGLVAWIADSATSDADVLIELVRLTDLFSGSSRSNVTALDHPGGDSLDQTDVDVGFDGQRYVVAYAEPKSASSDFDVRASVWQDLDVPTPDLTMIASNVLIAKTSDVERQVCVAGFDTSTNGTSYISWTRFSSGAGGNDIEAAIFTSTQAGGTTTVQTGCGSPEPIFTTSTPVLVGGPITLTQIGGSSPLLFVGFPTNIPLCPGQAPGCVLGVNPILVTPMPPFISTTVPIDGTLVGFTFAMQVIDVVPLSATGTICGPPKYSSKVRTSDTRVVTIQ